MKLSLKYKETTEVTKNGKQPKDKDKNKKGKDKNNNKKKNSYLENTIKDMNGQILKLTQLLRHYVLQFKTKK